MQFNDIATKILFYKPEISICKEGKFELMCEADMFNNHFLFFTREHDGDQEYDYECYSYYADAIRNFLEHVNYKEKDND